MYNDIVNGAGIKICFLEQEKYSMIPTTIKCDNCGAEKEINSWRKYVVCPYCKSKTPFTGFEYRTFNWKSSEYAYVKKWMDCPACRSKNMYLGPAGRRWVCPDCGYSIKRTHLIFEVFWFCDQCETFLNIQPGFTTRNKTWECTECGNKNDVTRNNIS